MYQLTGCPPVVKVELYPFAGIGHSGKRLPTAVILVTGPFWEPIIIVCEAVSRTFPVDVLQIPLVVI